MDSDRNRLFGYWLLQTELVSREQLASALSTWIADPSKSLGDVLVAQGRIDEDERRLVEAIVSKHSSRHQGDPRQTLAALSASPGFAEPFLASGSGSDAWTEVFTNSQDVAAEASPEQTLAFEMRKVNLGQGRYRIIRPHDKGGIGTVSVAFDQELQREVALKELQPRFADDIAVRLRFLAEAEITGRLEHPGVVPVYGLGANHDGRPYYTMRFIKGESFKEAIKRFHRKRGPNEPASTPLELRALLDRFIDVCNAVAYAHSRGVLHRDLKPANVMLGRYGETLVVDWGLARVIDRPAEAQSDEEPTLRPATMSGSSNTQMGSAIGTPGFMSPEQAAGKLERLGPTSDVYSLGAILYVILTGQVAIKGDSQQEVVALAALGEFVPPSELHRDVPRGLEAICLKAMSREPEGRYASAGALADDIHRWLADEPVSCYREPWWRRGGRLIRKHRAVSGTVAGVLAASLIALSGWFAYESYRVARVEGQSRAAFSRGVALLVANDPEAAVRELSTAKSLAQSEPRRLGALADQIRQQLDNAQQRADTIVEQRQARDAFADFRVRFDEHLARARIGAIYADLPAGQADCEAAAKLYEESRWTNPTERAKLPPEVVSKFVNDLTELAVLRARVEVDLANDVTRPAALRKGIEWLNHAESKEKLSRGLLQFRQQYYTALGLNADAQRDTALIEQTPPESALDYFLMAEHARSHQQLGEAVNHYESALARDPDHFWSHSMLAMCFLESRQPQRAVAEYTQAIRLAPTMAWSYVSRALAFADAGQWEASFADLDKADELAPAFYGVANNRGVVLLTRANLTPHDAQHRLTWCDEAIVQFSRAKELQPTFAGAMTNLGNAHRTKAAILRSLGNEELAKHEIELALAEYTTATKQAPNDLQALLNRGLTRARWGDLDGAEQDLKRVLETQPQSTAARLGLGIVYEGRGRAALGQGDLEKAETDNRRALEEYTLAISTPQESFHAYLGRGIVHSEIVQLAVRRNQHQAAVDAARQVIEDLTTAENAGGPLLSPDERAELYRARGVALNLVGETAQAMADFDRGLALDPSHPQTLVQRGWLQAMGPGRSLGDFDAALQHSERLEPTERAHAYNGRGYAHASAGDHIAAVADAEQAVSLAPQHWQIQFNAATVYGLAVGIAQLEVHDVDLARKYTQRALELIRAAQDRGLPDKGIIQQERAFVFLRDQPGFSELVK